MIIGYCNIHGKTKLEKKETDFPFIIGESRYKCLLCKKNKLKVEI